MGQLDAFPDSMPSSGQLRFSFRIKRTIAKQEDCISDKGLSDVLRVINSSIIGVEKLRWLALAMRDVFLLPSHAQRIIDEVGLRPCDVVARRIGNGGIFGSEAEWMTLGGAASSSSSVSAGTGGPSIAIAREPVIGAT